MSEIFQPHHGIFKPHHLNATAADLSGNNGIGRYVLLPGSDSRAEAIAERFKDLRVIPSPRRHNLHIGVIEADGIDIDVAAVATGMGCPSVDIIVQELYKLGARRFLRVGTAGSQQPARVRVGDLVVATAAVRDENTSNAYLPPEFPALASQEFITAARSASSKLQLQSRVHFGVLHTKDSLFAREFGEGPMAPENRRYLELLHRAGVLASEMEAAHLFILASLWDAENAAAGSGPINRVLAGAIVGVIGDDRPFAPEKEAQEAVDRAVDLALETVKQLASSERRTFS